MSFHQGGWFAAAVIGLSCGLLPATPQVAAQEPEIQAFLEQGRLAEGEQAMADAVASNPEDHQAGFSLGVVKFLRAVERLAQTHYKHGLLQHRLRLVPFVRLPVPTNKAPEEISYEDARKALDRFSKDLAAAEKTLSAVDARDVKLPLHFGRIRLDLDGDGESSEQETLWRIYRSFNAAVRQADAEAFQITFDGGDVHWLRGYCHLLMGMVDVLLAHDWRELFERTAQLFYPKVKSPHAYLREEDADNFDSRNFLDVIALVHLINFPVQQPKRMESALKHFEAMIDQSRASWKSILAETDDDNEWLPNPAQTGVIPNVRIRRDMIDGWHSLLGEMEAIFAGKKLVPFWRGAPGGGNTFDAPPIHPQLGVNLRKVFTQPRRLDLVLWIQGSAAGPYLEKGEMTDFEVWNRLGRVFGGNFFGFAIWFN